MKEVESIGFTMLFTTVGIQMFMDKLNHLINSKDIPFIYDWRIRRERHQLQLLYEELGSIIQILFTHQAKDLQQLIDLKKRFIEAAEEAEYIVDLFLSGVDDRDNSHDPTTSSDLNGCLKVDLVWRSLKSVVDFFLRCFLCRNKSLELDDVRRSLKSVEVEFNNMNISSKKMDLSAATPQTTLNQSAAAAQSSTSRNSPGSKKALDEINLFVGIDRDTELIRDKLVEDQKKLDVVPIVGMGGIGKTTLATKVFNDTYIKHHFHVRVWVTVSQTYDKRAVLTQILESICGQLDIGKADDSRLRELVHKSLMGKRYLIVIDDIWDIETWDNLKVFFPRDNNGSRILLTSRLTEVAKHACSNGLIHHLGCLNQEKCWKLLCEKVFRGSECPGWSIKPGMKIVESCQGLPLAVVVVAGVLTKEAWSKTFWEEISYKMGSYLVDDENGCTKTLALSYNHLPPHLRECFLYLGGFPEDYMFKIRELIWLWVAEGFIQHDGNKRLEDIAEGYLMDLIDRNLVIVDRWKSNGGVKACKVHDLIRELCLKKGTEEQFILKAERLTWSSELNKVKKPPYRPERVFIYNTAELSVLTIASEQNCRSFLVFGDIKYLGVRSFVLLRVLNLLKLKLKDCPSGMKLLVHLRYLSIWLELIDVIPDSICNLWNLQTLIYYSSWRRIVLPDSISDLVNLRHLGTHPANVFVLPSRFRRFNRRIRYFEPMKNLQTISNVFSGKNYFRNFIPNIKELTCYTNSENENEFQSLIYLENLNFTSKCIRRVESITFPATLKTLTLRWCRLQWSKMSIIIQSLPNLQVLKLEDNAFKGKWWNTDGQEFPQLKFLRLHSLDIKEWEANSRSFPCLRQLQIISCIRLEEIPLEIGDIPTLELIQIEGCRRCVGESVRSIEEDQYDNLGNYHLKIDIQKERKDE